ncbi:MAG: peptidylprolyl isomerase [Candidatus Aenigmarchaeota archaeon]|nr:peptidylprolyl isomerase [Candidatus Aenigmarchaeota archaeon]
MKTSDFIRIKYTGKVKEDNRVIDKNDDMPLVVGEKWIMAPLDEALLEMKVGEKKEVEIPSDKAFGQRSDKLIKTVPLSEFRKHNQKPVPGLVINADNRLGKVLSVSGGRVKVDFNHPLSGKTLVFDVEITKKIEKEEDKVKAVVEWFMRPNTDAEKEIFSKLEVKIHGKEIDIHIPSLTNLNSLYKKKIADDLIRLLNVEKIKFLEVYEKTVVDEKKIAELEEQLPVEEITEENN